MVFSHSNAKVIFNGVDTNNLNLIKVQKKLKDELKIPENYFVIGMVGRYSSKKS